MIRRLPFLTLPLAPAAQAREVLVGILEHGLDTPLTFQTGERGKPVAAIGAAGLQPYAFASFNYAFASFNTVGDTSLPAAGVALKVPLGGWFLCPGIGIAIHDGPSERYDAGRGYSRSSGAGCSSSRSWASVSPWRRASSRNSTGPTSVTRRSSGRRIRAST